MLRRFRRGFRRRVQRAGPFLVGLAAVAGLGFGAHAALDWHRHGSPGGGFFHLHVHFGHHHHHDEDGHHHHHGNGGRHDHDSSEPDSPTDRHPCGTLTLALGFAPAPTVVAVEKPSIEADEWASLTSPDLTEREAPDGPWSPRAPPT